VSTRTRAAEVTDSHYAAVMPPARQTLPPGPPLPLPLGTLVTWTVTLPFWEWCRARYGRMFTVRCFPWGTAVFISDSEMVKEVFTGDPAVFHAGEGNALLAPIVGERSLLLADEDTHLRARKRILPPFHGESVRRYASEVERIVADEVERWPIGEPFALHPRMTAIAFEVVLRAVIGVEDGERAAALRQVLPASAEWDPTILAGWAVPSLRRYGRWRRHDATVAETHRLLREEIAERRGEADLASRDDVLSQLIVAGDASDEELCDDVMTLLIAGEGTSAAALAWAFERLLRHPDALERAHHGDDEFLDAVVHETLRVRPVIPAVARQLQAPVELGGFEIPSGVTLLLVGSLLHSDPGLYPEPSYFRPERFLGNTLGLTYTWIPFGGGRRRCPGAALAALEMRIALRTILERVTLRADRLRDERSRHRNITLVPARGTRVVRTA
jgi:cytochrome P450